MNKPPAEPFARRGGVPWSSHHWVRFDLEGRVLGSSDRLGEDWGRFEGLGDGGRFSSLFCCGEHTAWSLDGVWREALSGAPGSLSIPCQDCRCDDGGDIECVLRLEYDRGATPRSVIALMRFPGRVPSEDGGEGLLAAALTASLTPSVIVCEAGNLVWCNEAFGFLLGRDREKLLGCGFLEDICGVEVDDGERGRMAVHLSGGVDFSEEFMARHDSGYRFWMKVDGHPFRLEQGPVRRLFVLHCSNVDAYRREKRDQMEKVERVRDYFKERSGSTEDLEAALDAACRELEALKRESESKTEFLANISHEIRTPMNAVIGFCDLLLSTDLDADQGECVEAIYHSGQLLIQLIGQVLDYSKVACGHLELLDEDVDLAQVMLEAQAIMGTRARSKGLAFELSIEGLECPFVVGDSMRIKQIVINLLGNAFKFTRQGKLALRARSQPSSLAGHARVSVEVEDSGIGIDPKRLSRLFDPFAQADSRIARDFGGSGLGLAICKKLCSLMNGNIWVERTSAAGSVFCFELNLPIMAKDLNEPTGGENMVQANEAQKESEKVKQDARSSSDKLRVLVVDDNPNNLLITSKLSEHLGYEAVTVKSGVEALESLKREAFSIILMDVRMAPINGMDTTKKIRLGEAGEANKDIYIIALTAHALQGDRERCLDSGMNDYLPKPLTLERLSETMKRAEASIAK